MPEYLPPPATCDLSTKPCDIKSALADVERHLAITQALARIGDWTLERDSARTTWSPELFRMFERPLERGVPDVNEISAYLSSESLERTRETFWHAIDSGERLTLEHEVVLPSGARLLVWANDGLSDSTVCMSSIVGTSLIVGSSSVMPSSVAFSRSIR